MKVFLLVCLGLLLVVSSGRGDAAVDKEDELSLKTLDTPALKDPSAGIPSLRNIREAEKKKGKQGKNKNDKKKTSKSKKNKGGKRKNSKGNTQKKKNKKSVKGQNQKRKGKKNKKKTQTRKKNKKTKQTRKKNKKKNQTRKKNKKKNQTRKKNKKRTSAKEKNKEKNKNPTKVKQENKKQKSGKGKNNSRKSKKGKNSRKKIKNAARKNKKKNKKSKTKSGRNAKKSKTGKNKSKRQSRLTCGSTQVNDTCLQNAVDALNFEKNQIQNFFKQKARLINHNKTTASKQGKKGEFEDAAKYLLQAIGGNLSAPTCGESGTAQKARSAKSASDTYKTLLNCSVSIKEACTMPTKTFNATIQATLDTCAGIYNISKMTSDTCRTESAFLSNGTLACECWSKAAIGIVLAKKNNCAATDTAKAVKKAKNKCIAAFSVCKKAEDSAVGLIHTCMAGEVKNISATVPLPGCPKETPKLNTACQPAEEGLTCPYGSKTCCGETSPETVMECRQEMWVDTLCMLGGPCPGNSTCLCTKIYSPVCGSDGKTYGNVCIAVCEWGVGITCSRECPCDECVCPTYDFFSPVCGSDGKTYSNACFAGCEGVGIACSEECPCTDCICPKVEDPVCGSDGKTYSNKCVAVCAGVKTDCSGECPCALS